MTDTSTTPRAENVADIEMDHAAFNASVAEFAVTNHEYYASAFRKIHNTTRGIPLTFNWAAALLGPIWSAARGIWGGFWGFLILEIIAWVQIGRGTWGELGADDLARAATQEARAQDFLQRAADAVAAGEDGSRFETLGNNLLRAAERSREAADAMAADSVQILITGLVLLVAIRVIQGVWANIALEKQYERWRIDPDLVPSGVNTTNLILGIALALAIAPLTVYRFTVEDVTEFLTSFPANPDHYSDTARWLEDVIDAAARNGAGAFDGIVLGIRQILDTISVALIGTPWPVVMTVICVVAWRAAGPRVAIFTAAALAYIAFLGYWEVSMETVALVGSAVFLCVLMGIPLGIWFGKSKRAYRIAEPVLDLMQTLPAFVYLIPIIAFFGTGNPPGILATIIFGMPPVIRLTALGMRGVPESIKEAASAFGASNWQILRDVELPLARPSIMTGVNQTILMCLSMVVIISLIGGGGLGQEILEALQFAAKGPGILGGLAILFVAMVIDRIVQGAFRRRDLKDEH
ncbi:ABC transporter permease subunit [Fontisubflavum oceani]|jgi:glycine betaine/proline transport system permease protein|uniref:ABC transporter permease n=1 Tax=Fontisubflavum oceani TaxID=2978973 RepID=UPI00119C1779|nr:ABC transporter permease subunit [Fontisubflavum oceani]WJY21209.1 ABC transporter permease subunit [Fontisubflavum oceani]